MRYLFYFLPIIVFIACSDTNGPVTEEPGRLTFVPKGPDTAIVERGIDAVPDKVGILLEWFKSNDNSIRYIDIYRQKGSETYFRKIRTIDLETASAGNDVSYIDESDDVGINVYNEYYLRALNNDGVEGQPSDTVQYNLLHKPDLSRPNGETIIGLPVFFWKFYEEDPLPHIYILRIQEEFTNRVVFVREFQVNYDSHDQSLDLSEVENPPTFVSGFAYRWRIDSVGPGILDPDDPDRKNYSGSESLWFSFIAN